jgi:GNAT superfamily N-acetyltransferase
MIAVDPGFQRQGIAGELSDFGLDEMRRRGMTLATVSTGGDPGHGPARETYEKAGFVPFPQVIYSKIIDPK